MSTVLHIFTFRKSFINKYWTILHFLVTFFKSFKGILKKADEENTLKLALEQQPGVRKLIVKQLLGPNYLVTSKNLKLKIMEN